MRKAWDIEPAPIFDVAITDGVFRAAPDDIELALKCHRIREGGISADEHLPDKGLPGLGGLAKGAIVSGDVAPTEECLAFFRYDALELDLTTLALLSVRGEENQAAAILAFTRQREFLLFARLGQKGVGHLHENARSVTGVVLASAGATMSQIQ